METEEKNSLDDDIGRQITELLRRGGDAAAMSERLSVLLREIEGQHTLNLNGIFKDLDLDKRRALTFVFKLVDGTSVHTLLLEDNNIDAASLGQSLLDLADDGSRTNLSNITKLSLAGNEIGNHNYSGSKERYLEMIITKNYESSLTNAYFDVFACVEYALRCGILCSLLSISFSRNPMSSRDLQKLGACLRLLPNLKCLLLSHMPKGAVAPLLSSREDNALTSLEEIDLSNNVLHGEQIEALCTVNWSQLRRLTLRNTDIEVGDCILLANTIRAGKLEALESIDLRDNMFGDEGMCALASSFHKSFMPKLQEISLAGTLISHRGVKALAKAITASGLQFLKNIHLPQNLLLYESSFTSLAILGSGQVSDVKTLSFNVDVLGNEGVITLAKAIEEGCFKSLEKLDLLPKADVSSNVEITDGSLELLAATFCRGYAANLQGLRMARIGWGGDGIGRLAEAIQSGCLQLLEELDLSGNTKITGRSLKFLTAAFHKTGRTKLRELNLAQTGLGDDAIVELAEAIKSHKLRSLETLNISNTIHDGSARRKYAALVAASSGGCLGTLMKGCYSERVQTFRQKLGFKGARTSRGKSIALLTASFGTGMSKLKRLYLNGTGLRIDGVRKLVDAMQLGRLKSLEVLDLSANPKLLKSSKEIARYFLMNLHYGNIPHLREVRLDDIKLTSDITQQAYAYQKRHVVHTAESKGENGNVVIDVEGTIRM